MRRAFVGVASSAVVVAIAAACGSFKGTDVPAGEDVDGSAGAGADAAQLEGSVGTSSDGAPMPGVDSSIAPMPDGAACLTTSQPFASAAPWPGWAPVLGMMTNDNAQVIEDNGAPPAHANAMNATVKVASSGDWAYAELVHSGTPSSVQVSYSVYIRSGDWGTAYVEPGCAVFLEGANSKELQFGLARDSGQSVSMLLDTMAYTFFDVSVGTWYDVTQTLTRDGTNMVLGKVTIVKEGDTTATAGQLTTTVPFAVTGIRVDCGIVDASITTGTQTVNTWISNVSVSICP
jgi:hypothetical protein